MLAAPYYLTEVRECITLIRMAAPISVRLDDHVRATLEADAKEHGIGLATYLRNIATDRAKLVRKTKIREESRLVAERNRDDPDAREFYDFWDRIARDAHGINRGR
jgi:hypothetical protein